MNAEKNRTVVCPTCQGSKAVRRGPGKGRLQACLACSATGRVEPWRVCPTCHKWTQACICHEDRFVVLPSVSGKKKESESAMRKVNASSSSGVTGVSWYSGAECWNVQIVIENARYFLGQYRSLDVATACRKEAEATAPEDFPDLRAKYKALDRGQPPPVATEAPQQAAFTLPERVSSPPDAPASPTHELAERIARLTAKIGLARSRTRELQNAAALAAADERALWDDLAALVFEIGADSDAFTAAMLDRLNH